MATVEAWMLADNAPTGNGGTASIDGACADLILAKQGVNPVVCVGWFGDCRYNCTVAEATAMGRDFASKVWSNLAVVDGNHEHNSTPPGIINMQAMMYTKNLYAGQPTTPNLTGQTGNKDFWYTVDLGTKWRLFAWSTEIAKPTSWDWPTILAQCKADGRWGITMCHRPMYNNGSHGNNEGGKWGGGTQSTTGATSPWWQDMCDSGIMRCSFAGHAHCIEIFHPKDRTGHAVSGVEGANPHAIVSCVAGTHGAGSGAPTMGINDIDYGANPNQGGAVRITMHDDASYTLDYFNAATLNIQASRTYAALAPAVASPVRAVSPSSVSFPVTAPGTISAAQGVTLSNTGAGTTLSGAVSLGGNSPSKFRITSSPLSYSVTTGSTIVNTTFNPVPGDVGSVNASLVFTDNASGSPQSLPLTGSVSAPQVGVIMLEGQCLPLTSSNAPFLMGYAGRSWNYTSYRGTSQPSLPDYSASTAGSWLGKGAPNGDDNGPYGYGGNQANIFTQIQGLGLKWKCYAEGVAGHYTNWGNDPGIFTDTHSGSASHYIAHHDPGAIYLNTQQGASHSSGRYDFDELVSDITGSTLPDYFWISPNGSDDGHDNSNATFVDNWARGSNPDNKAAGWSFQGVDALVAAMRPGGLLFITFDNLGGTTTFYTICTGPGVGVNTVSAANNHFTTLVAIQGLFGLPKFTVNVESGYTAANALPIPATIVNPIRSLSASSIAFPNTSGGTISPAQTVTVTNAGAGSLAGSVALTGTNPGKFRITTTPTTYSLASSASSGYAVTFNPAATDAGGTNYNANLTFSDNATGSPENVSLSGTVTPLVGNAVVSPRSLAFSVQAGSTSLPQTVTVTNNGGTNITVSTVALSGANFNLFTIATDGLTGQSIAAGTSKTCTVTFSPPVGSSTVASAILTVTDSTGSAQTQTVTLSGTPLSGSPVGSLNPASVAFPTTVVGTTSANIPVTITNTGGNPSTLNITSVALGGTNAGQFAITSDSGQTSLGFNTSRTVNVAFAPTSIGSKTATLTFTDNTGGVVGTAQSLSISGSGIASGVPAVTITPASPEVFPNTIVGQTSTQIVTVTNSGTANLIITSATIGTSSSG